MWQPRDAVGVQGELDQIIVDGRILNRHDLFPAEGRPAIVISARAGATVPAPKRGLDYVVPTLEAVLSHKTCSAWT
ncbi:hypothetical protein WEI85_24410 [Actinomycetes bacterium KLBMP 9797]